jgi:hypothetical protein
MYLNSAFNWTQGYWIWHLVEPKILGLQASQIHVIWAWFSFKSKYIGLLPYFWLFKIYTFKKKKKTNIYKISWFWHIKDGTCMGLWPTCLPYWRKAPQKTKATCPSNSQGVTTHNHTFLMNTTRLSGPWLQYLITL